MPAQDPDSAPTPPETDVPPGVTRIIYLPPRAGGRTVKDRLVSLAAMLKSQGREACYAANEETLVQRRKDPELAAAFPPERSWVLPSLPAVAHTTKLAQVALDSFKDPDLYSLGESYFRPDSWAFLTDPKNRGLVTILLDGVAVQGDGLEEGLIILDKIARLLRFEVIIVA